jgi:hypothetical protein
MGTVCFKSIFSDSANKNIFEIHDKNDPLNSNNESIENKLLSNSYSKSYRKNELNISDLFRISSPGKNLNRSLDLFEIKNKKNLKKTIKSNFQNLKAIDLKENKRSRSFNKEKEKEKENKPISSYVKKKNNEKMIKKLNQFRKKHLIGENLIEMDFAVEIFIQINTLRNNCLAYTKKIDFFSKFIEEIKGEKFLTLEMNDFISNSILVQGLPAFKEAIKFLEIYYKKYSTLDRLVHINDLKIPFPNDVKLLIDKNYIHNKAEEIKKKFKGKYEVTGYTYDITFKDAELTTIMQIVDDNYGNKNRRNNLLNKDIKYIGINYKKLNDEQYAVYILLAK